VTVAERFWAKVDRSGGPDACWSWTGALNKYGYPHFRMNGKVVRGNRLAIVLGDPEDVVRPGGRIPPRPLGDDELSCHGKECQKSGIRKACCNVAHLTPGDYSQNLIDAYERGERMPSYGENEWAFKRAKALHLPVRRDT